MIHQIDAALVNLLGAGLSDILPNPGQIGVCLPYEPGEVSLGLYLYNIRPCTDVNAPSIASKGRSAQEIPPKFLTLCYLMTAYSKADAPFRAIEDHRILYGAMRVFEQNQVLSQRQLGFVPGRWVDKLQLQMITLNHEQMERIWNFRDAPYRVSVAYGVFPVELPGLDGKTVNRVSSADFSGGLLQGD